MHEILFFMGSFVFLFFAPGYFILKKKSGGLDLVAASFVISCFLVLVESLLLAAFAALNAFNLLAFVGVTIGATLAYRSANP